MDVVVRTLKKLVLIRGHDKPQTKPPSGLNLPDLPLDIIWEILDYLDIGDKGCLALTCRGLFEHLGSIFEVIRFPREYKIFGMANFRYRDGPVAMNVNRFLFLRHLETTMPGYSFCWDCFRLHPTKIMKEFGVKVSHGQLKTCRPLPLIRRRKIKSCSCSRIVYPGAPFDYEAEMKAENDCAGLVDLCPCLKLSALGKRKLEKQLRKHPNKPTFYDTHQCQHRYPGMSVLIRLHPRISEETKELEFVITYRVVSPDPYGMIGGARIRCICPHLRLNNMVRGLVSSIDREGFVPEPGYDQRRLETKRRCPQCDTYTSLCNKHVSISRAGDYIIPLQVVRDLSKRNWRHQFMYRPDPAYMFLLRPSEIDT